ncbi:MAG: hypothetical protein SVX38_16070, partial [Chloroflexota bacterium]|nr:hypothetical protein [Chloroflexota bacterium]
LFFFCTRSAVIVPGMLKPPAVLKTKIAGQPNAAAILQLLSASCRFPSEVVTGKQAWCNGLSLLVVPFGPTSPDVPWPV